MREYIFKIIYYPISIIIIMCCLAVLGAIAKDAGWETPFRWLLIINTIAICADYSVNR